MPQILNAYSYYQQQHSDNEQRGTGNGSGGSSGDDIAAVPVATPIPVTITMPSIPTTLSPTTASASHSYSRSYEHSVGVGSGSRNGKQTKAKAVLQPVPVPAAEQAVPGGDYFVQIPQSITRSNIGSFSVWLKAVYGALLSSVGPNQTCELSQQTLAARAGCGTTKLMDALKQLRMLGLVTWQRRGQGRPNVYRVGRLALLPPKDKDENYKGKELWDRNEYRDTGADGEETYQATKVKAVPIDPSKPLSAQGSAKASVLEEYDTAEQVMAATQGSQWLATLYEHYQNGKGAGRNLNITGYGCYGYKVSDLRTYGFNDVISATSSDCKVTLYEHINFDGKRWSYGGGFCYADWYVGDDANDRASSVVIG